MGLLLWVLVGLYFWLMFTLACYFALMASDFSVSSNRKVTKRVPPLQLRPVKDTGFP